MTARAILRRGCLVAVVVAAVAAIAAFALGWIAVERNRTERRETRTEAFAAPVGAQRNASGAPGVLRFDVRAAMLRIEPVPAGEPFRVEANFDPRRYRLERSEERLPDGSWRREVRFGPTGSLVVSLLQVKLGGDPPPLRLFVPEGIPIHLDGSLRGGIAGLELGGLRLVDLDLSVRGGAVTVSFLEPLEAPMERLTVIGDRGSIEVTGVGNASPSTVEALQHLGELDLDLRGAWTRSARVDLDVYLAGGSVWLPGDVPVVREDRLAEPHPSEPEIDGRVLRLHVGEHAGRLAILD